MIKLIGLVLFIGGIIVWLKQSAANRRTKRHSRQLSKFATGDSVDFDALSHSFDTLIRKFPCTALPGEQHLEATALQSRLTIKFRDKYIIRSVTKSLVNNDYLVAADAKVKDFIPTRSGGRYIDKYYPASLWLKVNLPADEMEFYGPFPDDKQHQMLQQDLADYLFAILTQNRNQGTTV